MYIVKLYPGKDHVFISDNIWLSTSGRVRNMVKERTAWRMTIMRNLRRSIGAKL